ncbi:MAG: ABC transporter ATP-binding protein, partial [Candidatus Kapaibacterium sp.]
FRFYDPDEGRVLIDGQDINAIPRRELRRAIGTVQQENYLFSATIAENIAFGCQDASREAIIEAAKIAQIHDDILQFPNDYDTFLGERGVTLSGGQKQRVAIARAIIRRPRILILDDALSAVDTETEANIFQGLGKILSDCTTIIISHRISSVKNAGEIIYIENGRLIESGTHEELVEMDGHYAAINRRQKLQEEIDSI